MDRRVKILEAAERLISHYGVAKTTVGDIASEAKIGVGSVYLEFGSKDEIVAALAETHHKRLEYVELLSGEPTPQKLRDFLVQRLERFSHLSQKPHGLDLISCPCIDVDSVRAQFASLEREKLETFLRDVVEDASEQADTILELHDHFERQSCTERVTPRNFDAFVGLIVRGVFTTF